MALLIAAFTLLGAGGAFAASGVSSLVTGPDESSVGNSDQGEPFGTTRYATNDDGGGGGGKHNNNNNNGDSNGDFAVAGVSDPGTVPPAGGSTPPGGDALPALGANPPQGVAGVAARGSGPAIRPAVQTTAVGGGGDSGGGGKLPFTGFVALPLLLIGFALLASGLVLRRRVSAEELEHPAGS